MRVFVVACIVAAIIATGGAVVLHQYQDPADVAFATSAVRI
jgi:hypothetical protein